MIRNLQINRVVLGTKIVSYGWERNVSNEIVMLVHRMRGNHVEVADRWFASSKTCSECRCVKPELPLSERVFHCEPCGLEEDRDLNAAINLFRTVSSTGSQACRENPLGGEFQVNSYTVLQKACRAQKKMGTAHQARSSDRSSQVRWWRSATRHLLHYRAEGDSQNLGSSRKTKPRLAPATRALATGFRGRHLFDTPTRDGWSGSSHTSPRTQTLLHRLALFARVLLPSPGLTRTAQPHSGGGNSRTGARERMNFPILTDEAGARRPRGGVSPGRSPPGLGPGVEGAFQ